MGTLSYSMLVSLDGFVARPDGAIDWHVVDEEWHRFVNDQTRDAEALLYGRRMWQLLESFWPHADADPSQPDYIGEYSRLWKSKPKFVCSTTLAEAGWGAEILRTSGDVRSLKERVPGVILAGGPTLAARLAPEDLIDEYRIHLQPVSIGTGVPFWPPGHQERVRLMGTREFMSGVLYLHYSTR